VARDHWRDQPRWPRGNEQGGQWRESGGSGGGWIQRLLDRFRPGRLPAPERDPLDASMGDVAERVNSGEHLEIEYGGPGNWLPIETSRVGRNGMVVTRTGGGREEMTLRHHPGDVLRVRTQDRPLYGEFMSDQDDAWLRRISDAYGRDRGTQTNVNEERRDQLDEIVPIRAQVEDPSMPVGMKVMTPEGEGTILRRYRRFGLDMATVSFGDQYDPEDVRDYEVLDLRPIKKRRR